MCGILGIVSASDRPVDTRLLVEMSRSLRHRGPDDEGYLLANTSSCELAVLAGADTPSSMIAGRPPYSPRGAITEHLDWEANLTLGHRRLSILDLSPSGHQPLSNEDGTLWIVHNGEVYNYIELRAELASMGYRFQSATDTEVILAAYAAWGAECLTRFVGMWSFCIYDRRKRVLFCARDPFGIKPFYYVQARGTFAFASEPQALLRSGLAGRVVNPQRAYDYLRYGLTDYDHETLFTDIRQLPAAHLLELAIDDVRVARLERYWSPRRVSREWTEASASEELRQRFEDNVRLHLRSDVPIGSALSGGIDSSSVVMTVRTLEPEMPFHVFSYIAAGSPVNEERWIDLVGGASRSTVHKVLLQPSSLLGDLDKLIVSQGEPFGSTSIYAQRKVFELAAENGVKVMLDGQGADEALAGYAGYAGSRLASLVMRGRIIEAIKFCARASRLPDHGSLPTRALGRALPLPLQGLARNLSGNRPIPTWMNPAWVRDHRIDLTPPRSGYGRDTLFRDLVDSLVRSSLPMLLRYEDRNSMAFSIESRVPFLTTDLVDLALSFPENYLVDDEGLGKSIFRKAMRGLVPDQVLDRKDKIGFATPEKAWLKELRPWIEGALAEKAVEAVPALNAAEIRREIDVQLERGEETRTTVWRWLNFIRWCLLFEARFE